MMEGLEGWKTKYGGILIIIGALCSIAEKTFPIEEYRPWLHFLSDLLLEGGAGLGVIGIGHKVDKAKDVLIQSAQLFNK